MAKMIGFILSLVFLVIGFLGLTNLLPLFITYPILANLGAIALGILGLLILIYAGRGGDVARQRKENSQQREENEKVRLAMSDLSKRENEQLKREIEQLKKENEQQRNSINQ